MSSYKSVTDIKSQCCISKSSKEKKLSEIFEVLSYSILQPYSCKIHCLSSHCCLLKTHTVLHFLMFAYLTCSPSGISSFNFFILFLLFKISYRFLSTLILAKANEETPTTMMPTLRMKSNNKLNTIFFLI